MRHRSVHAVVEVVVADFYWRVFCGAGADVGVELLAESVHGYLFGHEGEVAHDSACEWAADGIRAGRVPGLSDGVVVTPGCFAVGREVVLAGFDLAHGVWKIVLSDAFLFVLWLSPEGEVWWAC